MKRTYIFLLFVAFISAFSLLLRADAPAVPPVKKEEPKQEPPKQEQPKPQPPQVQPPQPAPPQLPKPEPKPEPPKPAEPPKPSPEQLAQQLKQQLQQQIRAKLEIAGTENNAAPFNAVDKPILDILKQKNLKPAAICSDSVFIRRVYLDLIGTIPSYQEIKQFVDNPSATKRSQLIDALLERPEFVEYWTLKWADILRVKAEFPINLWPNGAMVYQRWIRESVKNNKPLDVFTRELLLGSGSNFRNPPSNFYRAVSSKDPPTIAQTVSLTLFGVRFDKWDKDTQKNLPLFFSRIGYKGSAEWKEEIVFWIDKPLENPELIFPDGQKIRIKPEQDPRAVFADWFVQPKNPWFVKNIVNRYWFWIFGRGIVQEPDDFRADNPPSIPALLDVLSDEFVKSKYDFKQFLRLVLNSRTYQQSSLARCPYNDADKYFAAYPARQLDAEILEDIFCRIFYAGRSYASDVPEPYTFVPNYQRTFTLADGSITSPFLETFGRPPRDTGLLSERNPSATSSQRMFLINSAEMVNWVEQYWRIRQEATTALGDVKPQDRTRKFIEYLWVYLLAREPSEIELRNVEELLKVKGRNETVVFQDLIWTLVNSKEFLCRH
jgi:hypothetical protein